ncbi:hypothetical protein TNCV_1201691 [Trichonephila clavipes]|nr:hypothetical protein TNCV_1201691 [Trichonephila clavipes]
MPIQWESSIWTVRLGYRDIGQKAVEGGCVPADPNHNKKRISKKFGDSRSLDEDDWIELMTVYDNKEVDIDEVESEVQLFTAD